MSLTGGKKEAIAGKFVLLVPNLDFTKDEGIQEIISHTS